MRKKRQLAKDAYKEEILRLANENGGAVKLEETARLMGTGKTYAWKLLQELVEKDILERAGYGLYLLRG
jgi:DNA-binding IclR family transcriptional regulator